jgi:ATP-dependent helicase/nuclease subunit B
MNVKKTLADWADSLKPDDPTEKRIHRQIWEKVESLFDQLGVIYSNQDVTLEEFLEILTQSFTEITIGVIPPTADQVLIGTIDRMRHPAIRASFILGFNETIWPAPMNEDVLLCDEERLKLKSADLPLTGDVETHFLRERYFVYTAFTRPSEKLWISYSRKDSGGSPLQPSRYLKTLTDFATVQTFYPADADHLAEKPDDLEDEMNQIPLTEYQLFSRAVLSQNVNLSESGKTFWKHLAGVLSERELMADYTKRIVETISNRNMAKLERDLAIKLFSERISFSKIETYYKCPFQFFLVYGLQLAEKPRYLLEPADMGEFRHAVMKSAWKDLVGGSDETSQEIIERASKRAAETIRDQVLFETARNRYILEKIIAELVTALDGQRRMMEGGNIYPAEFEKEVSFSMDDGPHSCVLVGRIDRVDISRENESRLKVVVDYKAKGMMFDFVSWHAGTQLQLPGYLYLETRENFVPAGAVYMALEPSRPGSQNKHLFPISGIFSKESVERLYNQTSEKYPYQIKEGKEGIVSRGNVHVLDEAVFTNLLDKTFEMVKKSVSEFMSGDITITPFYHKKRSACMFCRKQSVCRFDSFVNKYRTISLKTKDEILTELS